ncbi:MAG: S41 family peptidase [Fimbriimonadaceae bacterium]
MRIRAISTAIALVLSVATFAQPQIPAFNPELKAKVIEDVNRIVSETAFVPGVDFSKWPEFIKGEQTALDKATSHRDLIVAVNQALEKFGISHIVLSSPEMAFARSLRRAVGIGIQIEIEPEGKGIRVVNVYPGSGAEEAGLKPGDLIFEHNGKPVKTQPDLAGNEGEEANIKLHRDDKVLSFKIVRRPFSNVRPETLSWPAPDTARLVINTFDLSYDPDNVDRLMTEAAKAKNLILDLRSNGGGAVVNMMHLLTHLVPPQTPIGSFIGRSAVNNFVKETGDKPDDLAKIAKWNAKPLKTTKVKGVEQFKGNIAVLVDGGSGSASEITAAALQEVRGASVVGQKSAGAVLVSVIRPISNGYTLQYPITDFVTPNGVRLEGRGVIPLLETKTNFKFGEKDEAVEKAVLLLGKIAMKANGG